VADVKEANVVPSADAAVPQALRDAWAEGEWRGIYDAATEKRTAALPALLEMLNRFVRGDSELSEFTKESQDFARTDPHWGFSGFAQMQLNQYAKVARTADVVNQVEGVLRNALRVPSDEEHARSALRAVVELTKMLVDDADRVGIGKPAPGRVPLVVSYFWEAQARDQWPIAYPASKATLEKYGLYREGDDPVESYFSLRRVILELGRSLGGDVWAIEPELRSILEGERGGR
jgi:hypothetical protein